MYIFWLQLFCVATTSGDRTCQCTVETKTKRWLIKIGGWLDTCMVVLQDKVVSVKGGKASNGSYQFMLGSTLWEDERQVPSHKKPSVACLKCICVYDHHDMIRDCAK